MYHSTRGGEGAYTAAEAIKRGISGDGGLFVPVSVPQIGDEFLHKLNGLTYQQRAIEVLALFLTDYTRAELAECVNEAYNSAKFDNAKIAPVVTVGDRHVLELWHGPTSAFKDMALQLLPQLLSRALVKTGEEAEIVILVATSGDTGKAALEGFCDVRQTRIIVFFPNNRVSPIQCLQMVTQQGKNVAVVAVEGNFDDAQSGVKRIFNDEAFNAQLARRNYKLSSANSINWGRLVPQIIYYFSAYADLVSTGRLKAGEKINFVVPTGNFGNILAGYYARCMGLPINKLICASNKNNVLTEFLQTGRYNRNRAFYQTTSPSMDILISSNLERLLYHITNGDTTQVAAWMAELNTSGQYQISSEQLADVQRIFWAGWTADDQAAQSISDVFAANKYVLDPHTAVAWHTADEYRRTTGDNTPIVVVSTASPFKFNETVLTAIASDRMTAVNNEFECLKQLTEVTGWPIPPKLAALEHEKIRHRRVCAKEEMPAVVQDILK